MYNEMQTNQPKQNVFPVLPLKNSVLFPGLTMPLMVGRPASLAAVESAAGGEDNTLLIVTQKDETIDEPKLVDLYPIATRAVILEKERVEDGMALIVQGRERFALVRTESDSPFLQVHAQEITKPEDANIEVEALHRAILEQAGKIIELVNPEAKEALAHVVSQIEDPLDQVYFMASMLPLDVEKQQRVLAAGTRSEALQLMLEYITHESQVLELRQQIASQAQNEMGREQREYMLRQQMRAIQDELGESSAEQSELGDLRKQLDEADLPETVRKEAERDLTRLERIPAASPEHQMMRSYLELVLELPWTKKTEDNLDLERAQQILDDDHYSLEDVKERIIEHLAVLKLNPDAKPPILCFVGPPGVGKTSLGQSIARALGREFERMSLGGLHDEAELRGHRRTYIGAMPGRFLQAIRRAGVKNPMIMLDEVDKVGRDYRGDPTSALLEILDPAQNHEFRDNYLDLPFDLSGVLFVTTANSLDTIPGPLLDRMEVIRLSGYTDDEKLQIAKRYLIPRQLEHSGLTDKQLSIPDQTMNLVIRRYTREAGVRELDRTINRLGRKVATRFAKGETHPVTIGPEDVSEYLGRERFFQEDARQTSPAGVAAGLAYTPVGGEVLYVEAVLLSEGRELKLTGKLGDVMKESAEAARSFIHSRAEQLEVNAETLERGVHIHVPAGATPKDGPSAGVTMATTLASLYTNQPVRSDTAMTGEISLSGLVLPVGGIKEKVLAAHRARMRRVILPRRNEQDLDDLPTHVREAMEFVFVDRIEDVLAAAIPELACVGESMV